MARNSFLVSSTSQVPINSVFSYFLPKQIQLYLVLTNALYCNINKWSILATMKFRLKLLTSLSHTLSKVLENITVEPPQSSNTALQKGLHKELPNSLPHLPQKKPESAFSMLSSFFIISMCLERNQERKHKVSSLHALFFSSVHEFLLSLGMWNSANSHLSD